MSNDPFRPEEADRHVSVLPGIVAWKSIVWAFSPALLLVASVVPGGDSIGGILPSTDIGKFMLGLALFGGPLVLFAWSLRAVWRIPGAVWIRVTGVFACTLAMIVANLAVAGLGCAVVNSIKSIG